MPLYMEIMDDLLKSIKSGKYMPGEALPTEEELRKIYGTSRTSIRNSLNELQNRGFIDKKRGSGNYVRQRSLPVNRESAINIGVIADLHSGKQESGLFASPLCSNMMLGVQKIIAKEGANLTIAMYHRESKTPGKEINSGYPIDGFLDFGSTITDELNRYFVASSAKVISILPYHNLFKYQYSNPLVILDECSGIKDAVRFYMAKGLSKFGYIGLAENGLRNYRMFQEAFKSEGIFFDSSCVIIHPESTANLTNLWERLQEISANIKNNQIYPDVFFFDGLTIADYLLKLFIEKNIGIEKKVCFCSIGSSVEEIMNPSFLDLIEPQYQLAGEKAAGLLIEYIKNGKVKQDRISAPSIFISHK